MRPSKLTYYADFVAYPAVIVGLAGAGLVRSTWPDRSQWLCVAAAGFVAWTFLEYVLHRAVLHRKTYFAPMHAQHHAAPLAFIGTPPWVSISVLSAWVLMPAWWWAGFNIADGLSVGVMLGYWWYGLVHHVIHRHADRPSSSYFRNLRAWHMRHHFSPRSGNFGVTTSVWDHIFGTAIPAGGPALPGR